MVKIETNKLLHDFILSHYAVIATLIVLLDRSSLTNEVKNMVKKGPFGVTYKN